MMPGEVVVILKHLVTVRTWSQGMRLAHMSPVSDEVGGDEPEVTLVTGQVAALGVRVVDMVLIRLPLMTREPEQAVRTQVVFTTLDVR